MVAVIGDHTGFDHVKMADPNGSLIQRRNSKYTHYALGGNAPRVKPACLQGGDYSRANQKKMVGIRVLIELIEIYKILQIFAAILVVIPLARGALSDIRIRKFPVVYWYGFTHVAGIFTVLAYLVYLTKDPVLVAAYALLSVIFTAACYAMGIRYGSGGDWRALMYCALLAPLITFNLVFWLSFCIISIAIAVLVLMQESKVHVFERHIPWSVAIFAAFVVSTVYFAMELL